ncbi:MAG: glycerol kinase [Candidatus Atribacteria bacterium]|nr:glycerol kinase [Candidatus Atribacteria bacterium]
MTQYFLTIDLGTTSVKLIVWDKEGQKVYQASFPVKLDYPREGWVEFDPELVVEDLFKKIKEVPFPIESVGITNQRETTVVWDENGKLLYPAIVWQDRRTAEWCERHRDKTRWLREKTGLPLDPYFSLGKLAWIRHHSGFSTKCYFGTLDTFVIWRLTNGKSLVTDHTNASRTMVYNIHQLGWDQEIIKEFDLDSVIFPEIHSSFSTFGKFRLQGKEIPIRVILGDQQASFLGQGCFCKGDTKNTYGTGCFLMTNLGDDVKEISENLIITIASLEKDHPIYALEGSAFNAGVLMDWLVKLGLVSNPVETELCAREAIITKDLLILPAFTGLGAPYWDPYARGAIFGITPQIGKNEIIRAALEAVAFESGELIREMDTLVGLGGEIIVDGGMTKNKLLMQIQADISGKKIKIFPEAEATSMGVFYLMGNRLGFLDRKFIEDKKKNSEEYIPHSTQEERDLLWNKWIKGIERVKGWAKSESKY